MTAGEGPFPFWVHHVFFAVDLLAFFLTLRHFLLVSFTLLLCADTCAFLYISHLREINRIVEKLNRILKQSKTSKNSSSSYLAQLQYFMCEHTRLCVVIRQVNAQTWSAVMAFSMGGHMPSNVYLLYRLLLPPPPPPPPTSVELLDQNSSSYSFFLSGQYGVTLFLLILQASILLACLLPLAVASADFHRSAAYLFRTQLRTSRVLVKLKLAKLYERVASKGYKYGITVGATGTVTYHALFEGLFLYVAFTFKLFELLL